ncbi:putative S-acyltransferase [Apostasia shenzhenica]|uniref:S-acyltransferase n=1 Tax=Apostasia shenzhenica TaxID=1088818 RepID=A0A2I0AVZ5_9ASPA|nr:putative S-acyltransferase [Apostasia shenzhenica]
MQEKMYAASRPTQDKGSSKASGQTNRVYQVWKGNNIFCFGGRFIFGPDARSIVLTIFLIVIPVLLFAVFVTQRLVNEFDHHLGYFIVGIAVGFTIYDIFLLLLTSSGDPGILPRKTHSPESENFSNLSRTGSHHVLSCPLFKDVIVNGMIVRVKYCHTCMLYRPPRCSHCSICNNCVERFDHHCPWVGQCIGKRNYRFFFMFVSSSTILCLYVLTFCCVNLKKIMAAYRCNLGEALITSPVSGVLIVYTFVIVWFVGGLTIFHLYLISTNQTTYENFRYHYDAKLNPYNRGCAQNIKEIFFSRIPESKNDFRSKVKEDDANLFSSSLPTGNMMSSDTTKTSFDVEIGLKRQAVTDDEFGYLHSQISSVSGLEISGSQPMRSRWGSYKGNWEMSAEFDDLSTEFRMENMFSDTAKLERKFGL